MVELLSRSQTWTALLVSGVLAWTWLKKALPRHFSSQFLWAYNTLNAFLCLKLQIHESMWVISQRAQFRYSWENYPLLLHPKEPKQKIFMQFRAFHNEMNWNEWIWKLTRGSKDTSSGENSMSLSEAVDPSTGSSTRTIFLFKTKGEAVPRRTPSLWQVSDVRSLFESLNNFQKPFCCLLVWYLKSILQ